MCQDESVRNEQRQYMYVCVSNSDKRPCSLDLRVTQRWQIVSLSFPLITALDPNWEFHLQTARFDGQMFAQLPMGVQAEYFLSKCLHSCFYFLCFISLCDDLSIFGLVLFPLGKKKRKTHWKLFPLRVFYCHNETGVLPLQRELVSSLCWFFCKYKAQMV